MKPPAASTAAAWYAAFPPGGSRTGCAPMSQARSAEEAEQRLVALERHGRAAQRGDRSVHVGEGHQRVEARRTRAGRLRRVEHGRRQRAAGMDDALAAVEAQLRGDDGTASSGTVRKRRSTSSRSGRPRSTAARSGHQRMKRASPPRVATGDRHNGPARAAERDAERKSGVPAADEPDARPAARIVGRVRVAVPGRSGIAVHVTCVEARGLAVIRAAVWRAVEDRGSIAGHRRTKRASSGAVAILRGLTVHTTRGGHTRQEPTSPRSARDRRPALDEPAHVPPDPLSARDRDCASATASVTVYRLDRARPCRTSIALPMTVKVLLENVAAQCRPRDASREADVRDARCRGGPVQPAEAEVPVPARARPAPGLHGRARGRRPGRDARRDGGTRRRPRPHQPARARGPGHRPLGPGRPLRHLRRVRLQRRARVRAQRRALPAAALGAERRSATCASCRPGTGHRPPGQPRVPGQRGRCCASSTASRLRSRTRSSAPTRTPRWSTGWACWATASVASRRRPCCSASRSTSRCRTSSACGSTASCRAARRPRTWCSSSARCCARTASSARSSSSPATGSPRWRWPTGRPSPTCRPSTARRPRSSRSTTRRSPTCA